MSDSHGLKHISRSHYNHTPRRCELCEDLYTPTGTRSKYCSDECQETARQSWYLKRLYKITPEIHQQMKEEQNNQCKICGSEGFTMADHHVMKLVVDHDHDTGKIRGLLCHNCNRALGLFKESIHTMEEAMKYLIDSGTAKI